MHILQLLSSTAYHGAEAMVAELTRQLHHQGARVDIAVLDNAGRGDAQIFQEVAEAASATHVIPCNGRLDLDTLRALKNIKASRKIDVVHSHKYKTTFYAALARTKDTALITTYHNWLYDTRALRAYAWVDKKLARLNELCVGVSTPVTHELRRHVPASRVLQIDNGIDTARYTPSLTRAAAKAALGRAPDRPLVGFVGRLSVEKGLPHLINALGGVQPADFDALIVGDGDLRAPITEQVQAAGLSGRVSLLGNRRDTPAIYAAVDVFVLPSLQEAFPMVVLEAMAAGCAVVATSVGEVGRILRHGVDGLIVPPGDPLALREAITTLLRDPAMRSSLGSAAQLRVGSSFSSASMARAYLLACERAMA